MKRQVQKHPAARAKAERGVLNILIALVAVCSVLVLSWDSAIEAGPSACGNSRTASNRFCSSTNAVGSTFTIQALYPAFVSRMGANNPSYAAGIPTTSPSPIAAGDFVTKFVAPNNAMVTVVVKAPVVSTTYTAPSLAAGQDPAQYFASVIAAAGSGVTIMLPKSQVYNFNAINCSDSNKPNYARAHLAIANVHDVVIDGNGGVLNFASACVGLDIEPANRVLFENFTIDWPNLQFAALATVTGVGNGTYDIQLQPQFLKGSLLQILAATAWDSTNNYWSLTQPNLDVTYGTPRPISASGAATGVPNYGVPFQTGQTLLIREFFSGNAIVAVGNDITFNNVTINSAPGLGFLFYGHGLHIVNCKVTRSGGRPISTSTDAVHSGSVAGDVVIEKSTFAYEGDDGTNLHTGLNPITTTGSNQITVPAWLLPQPGDPIGLFTSQMQFTGSTTIAAGGVASSGSTDTLTLSEAIPAADANGYLVDLALPAARYVIRNNQYLHNRARGLLLQSPYGLVQKNTFIGQTLAQIYVVTSAFWNEGPGAQNILIAGNHLSQSGANEEQGAIVVGFEVKSGGVNYATQSTPGTPPIPPVHQNIVFAANTVENEPRAGLYLSSANDVILYGNKFANLNQVSTQNYNPTKPAIAPTNYPVEVDDASNFYSCKNTLNGVALTSGAYWTDPDTTTGIVLSCSG
jgi:hypothetical protein